MKRVLKADSNCVDVGGHEGDILREMIRYSPSGKHFCFEPIPSFSEKIKSRFPQSSVYQLALSDKSGETTFQHVLSNPAYSGLKQRQYKGQENIVEIKVKTDLLDNILPEGMPVHLIKIDVEGGELGVLRGASKTISHWKPYVIFEHGKGASEFYGTKPEDVYDFFAASGMKISLLEDWLKNNQPLSKSELKNQYEKQLNYYFIAHS